MPNARTAALPPRFSLARFSRFHWRETSPGRWVVYEAGSSQALALTSLSAAVLDSLDNPSPLTAQALLDELSPAWDGDAVALQEGIRQVLDDLVSLGWIDILR